MYYLIYNTFILAIQHISEINEPFLQARASKLFRTLEVSTW